MFVKIIVNIFFCRRLIQIVNPYFLKEYNGYKLNLYRANSMRYYIMYYFGGKNLICSSDYTKWLSVPSLWSH